MPRLRTPSQAMLHRPARGTGEPTGKAKSGGTTAWVDSRRKGAPTTATPAAEKQSGDNHGYINTLTDRNSGNGRSNHGDAPETPGTPTKESTRGDEAKRAPSDSVPAQPPPSSAVPSSIPAAVAAGGEATPGTAALLLATTACQRRGRAQKKRARKIKDGTRQLCLEAATAVLTAPKEEAPSSSPSSSPPSPWPRLERAARELGDLARAKARLEETKLALQAAAAAAMSASAAAQGSEDLVAGLPTAAAAAPAADSQHPAVVTGLSRAGLPDPRPTSSAGDHPGEGSRSVGTAATAAALGGAEEEASLVAGSARKGRTASLMAEEAEEGLSSGDGGGSCSGDGSGGGGSDQALRPSHRKTRRGKRAGGAINRRRSAKERAASSTSATAPATAAAGAQERDDLGRKASGDPDVAESRELPVSTAAAAASTAAVVWSSPAGEKHKSKGDIEIPATDGMAQSTGAPGQEERLAAATATATDGENNFIVVRDGRQERGGSASAGGEADAVVAGCASEEGHVSGTNGIVGAVAAAASFASGISADSPPLRSESPPLSSRDVAALEKAACRSLRDLRAMCSSAFSSAAAAPLPPPPPSSSSSSSSADGGGAAGANAEARTSPRSSAAGRLCRQARLRGVLDSLASVCAPFPWTPVVTPSLNAVPTASGGAETVAGASPSPAPGVDAAAAAATADSDSNLAGSCTESHGPSNAGPAAAGAAARANVSWPSASGARQQDAAPGRRGARKRPEEINDHDHAEDHRRDDPSSETMRAAAGTPPRSKGGSETNNGGFGGGGSGSSRRAASREVSGGAGGDGGVGREAMTESALDVLLVLLAEEPGNRDYVLKMDGGAPLVSGNGSGRWLCSFFCPWLML